MSDQKAGESGGVHVTIPSTRTEITVSDHSFDTFERMWDSTLQWSHDNPLQFVAVVLLLAFAIYQRRLRLQNVAKDKLEFNARRQSARQPELPHVAPRRVGHDRD